MWVVAIRLHVRRIHMIFGEESSPKAHWRCRSTFNVQRSPVRVTVPLGVEITRRCFKQRLRNTVVPKSEGSMASAPLYLEFGALYTNYVPLCAWKR